MKTLTLFFAFFLGLVSMASAASSGPTALRNGVSEFMTKARVLHDGWMGRNPVTYTLLEKVTVPPASDNARRVIENLIMRDAAALSSELTALAKQATPAADDQKIVGQINRVKESLDAAKKDKAKIADAIRQLGALR